MSIHDNQDIQKRKLIATSIVAPFSGMISKFFCHPIDTIKSKLQVSRTQMKNFSEIKQGAALSLIKKTYQNEGLKGFFRGVTISVFGSAIAFSFYMLGYQHSKNYLSKFKIFQEYPSFSHLLSGFFAEIISCSLWLPIDIVKERLQVQSEVKVYSYKGPLEAIRKINLSEGIIGLYRAFGATLLMFGPYSALQFSFFEFFKEKLVKQKNSPTLVESIICSSSAGALAGFLTTPLELVKLRMQIQRADVALHGGSFEQSIFGYKNVFHGLYLIYYNQGFAALYRGASLRICFVVPMTTLALSLTDYLRQVALREQKLIDWFM